MRARKGFVANSSTSSFLIYGTFISREELAKRTGEECAYNLDTRLFTSGGPEFGDYGWYIGREWDSMKDDETKAQFMERVNAELRALLGEDFEGFSTYQEAWRDG